MFGACATDLGAPGRVPQVCFSRTTVMENHEKWMELCALAAKEQDPAKLLQLTKEIIRLVDEKDARLKSLHQPADSQKPQT